MARASLWTQPEEEYLIKNYSSTPINHLAQVFGRSIHAIECKANELRRQGIDIGSMCPVRRAGKGNELDIPDKMDHQRYQLTVTNGRDTLATFTCINRDQVLVITTRYYAKKYNYSVKII